MKNIVIIGAGGFGREVAWLIEEINEFEEQWNLIGFVDDDPSLNGKIINGYEVLGNIDWLIKQELNVVNAIANPIIKRKTIERILGSKNKFPILIHPSARCSKSVKYGEGTIICAGNIITVNIELGSHVIVNLDCTIGHDAVIGNYSTILPSVNISGFVKIHDCCSIGTGSAIIQGVSIGENTTIGAGSVVVKDIPANCTAVGVPAKPIKYHE